MTDRRCTVWWHNVLTGIPEPKEALRVSGNFVEYVGGGRSWGWHFATREEALESGRQAILSRIANDAAFAKRHKKIGEAR